MDFLLRFRRSDSRPRFVVPLPAARPVVVLDPAFHRSPGVRYVDPSGEAASVEIRALKPATLAGSSETLLEIVSRPDPVMPTHTIVVFTRGGEPCLSEASRDRLWAAYGLPIFEQVLGPDGTLLAWECEAHDGLHLARTAEAATGALIEYYPCDCGESAPRAMEATTAPRAISACERPILLIPARLGSSARPIST
jgi:hypothetical protein